MSTDPFTSASMERNPIKRDRWGRYLLPHPETARQQPWQRVTTFAKMASDTFALNAWQQRMTLKGAALRPDLVAGAFSLDVKADRGALGKLVEEAKDAAGQKRAANMGTALHSMAEELDTGRMDLEDLPAAHRGDLAAYRDALEGSGIGVLPHLVERTTCSVGLDVAGTFDRIVSMPGGERWVADLKTGADLSFSWTEIAVQLYCYAAGVNEAGAWTGSRWEPVNEVSTERGLVMHLPVGKGECTLYEVDLEAGAEGAELCAHVRAWRKRKDLARVWVLDEPSKSVTVAQVGELPPESGPEYLSWGEQFKRVRTRDEANALYRKARSAGLSKEELDWCIELGGKALYQAQMY